VEKMFRWWNAETRGRFLRRYLGMYEATPSHISKEVR